MSSVVDRKQVRNILAVDADSRLSRNSHSGTAGRLAAITKYLGATIFAGSDFKQIQDSSL